MPFHGCTDHIKSMRLQMCSPGTEDLLGPHSPRHLLRPWLLPGKDRFSWWILTGNPEPCSSTELLIGRKLALGSLQRQRTVRRGKETGPQSQPKAACHTVLTHTLNGLFRYTRGSVFHSLEKQTHYPPFHQGHSRDLSLE